MRHGKTLVLAAVALALFARPAYTQTTLRYKFKAGEKLDYGFTMDMQMAMGIGGKQIDMKTKYAMDMIWNIDKVDARGNARVRLKFNRVKMSVAGPMGTIEASSDDKKAADEDEARKVFAQTVQDLAALEMTFTMTPQGEMKDTAISEESIKRLKANPGAGKFTEEFTNPDALKKMMGGSLFVPKGPVSKGAKWAQKLSMNLPMMKMVGEMKFTYDGSIEKNGKRLEKVAIQPEFKIEGDPASPLKIEIKSLKLKGHGYFDNQAGRLVEITNGGTMEMEIGANGMTLTQHITQNSVMRLKPRSRPR